MAYLNRLVFLPLMRRSYSCTPSKILPSIPQSDDEKLAGIRRLIEAKEKSGLTFSEIANRCGITNAYCAQLFYGRCRVDDEIGGKLKQAIPALTDQDIDFLKRAPLRTFDERQWQDPFFYRLQEAISQYGQALKAVVTEEFGDGIMSAVDMYVKVDKVVGPENEARVVITLNGKFLPHVIQKTKVLEKMRKDVDSV